MTTNAIGFENAYLSPSGSSPTFATTGVYQGGVDVSGAVNMTMAQPLDAKTITTQYNSTWDANLLYLKQFLDGGNPLFLFNNNDTNKDQNLAIWAKLWLTDGTSSNPYAGRYLYLTNTGGYFVPTSYPVYGYGGLPSDLYPTSAMTYNGNDFQPGYYGDSVQSLKGFPLPLTDYVMSGGDVCVLNANTYHLGGCTANEKKAGWTTINHNLGANQVAYVGDVPLLDQWLGSLFALSDSDLAKYSLHLQLNLGCNPATFSTVYQPNDQYCDIVPNNVNIDNGYEQLFLASSKRSFDNPEPATLALFGLGLFGLAASRRRHQRQD